MAEERKKISELAEVSSIQGDENLLLGVSGGNKRATTEAMKEYIGASVTRVFTDRISGTVTIINGSATPEENAVIDVVYLTDLERFASRKNINGAISYFSEWNGREEYQSDSLEVRTDRLFYCTGNQTVYSLKNGTLVEQINESVSVFQESTEEEIEDMIANGTWKEGVIYYTVEE